MIEAVDIEEAQWLLRVRDTLRERLNSVRDGKGEMTVQIGEGTVFGTGRYASEAAPENSDNYSNTRESIEQLCEKYLDLELAAVNARLQQLGVQG